MKLKIESSHWKSPTIIISVLSVIFSIVALLVSIRGCGIAEKSLELSPKDFNASRSVVYKGKLNKDNDEIFLLPTDPNIQIQYGAIFLPPQIDNAVWPISPPNYGFSLLVLRVIITNFLEDKASKEKGYVKHIYHTGIPIIIHSTYVAKGESYSEQSLYQLIYTGIVSDEVYKRSTITFEGLAYIKRLPPNTDSHIYLKPIWDKESIM